METKIMTVLYKKRDFSIQGICEGKQTLQLVGHLDIEDAELIYGLLEIEYNQYILYHPSEFELVQDETTKTLSLKMKNDIKEQLKSFI